MTERQLLRKIGESVRTARLRLNLTQECVAELTGVHWQTISHIENGKFPFSIVTFARISQALAISANCLLEGLPEMNRARLETVKTALARKRKQKARRID